MPWVSPNDIISKEQYIKNCEDMKKTMEPCIDTLNALIELAESKPDDYIFINIGR